MEGGEKERKKKGVRSERERGDKRRKEQQKKGK